MFSLSVRAVPPLAFQLLMVPPALLAKDGWQYRLTPDLWFAGLKGSVATIPGAPAAPIDVSPSEAIEDTEASLMLLFDAKHARHGVFSDLVYSDVRSDAELPRAPIGLTLRSISKTTVLSLAYQYEVFGQDRAVVDVMLGARYWNIDTELRFGGGGDCWPAEPCATTSPGSIQPSG